MCSLFHTKCELHNAPKIQKSALFAWNVKTALLKSTLVSLSLAMKKRCNFNPAIRCTFLSSFEHCELMSHICCFYSIECNEAFRLVIISFCVCMYWDLFFISNKCRTIFMTFLEFIFEEALLTYKFSDLKHCSYSHKQKMMYIRETGSQKIRFQKDRKKQVLILIYILLPSK